VWPWGQRHYDPSYPWRLQCSVTLLWDRPVFSNTAVRSSSVQQHCCEILQCSATLLWGHPISQLLIYPCHIQNKTNSISVGVSNTHNFPTNHLRHFPAGLCITQHSNKSLSTPAWRTQSHVISYALPSVPKECDTIIRKGSGGPSSRWTQHIPSEHHSVMQHHIECCKNLSTKEFTESGNTVWSLEWCIPDTSVVMIKMED
jgi:hypothetical protein